jgi:hypothetical protein
MTPKRWGLVLVFAVVVASLTGWVQRRNYAASPRGQMELAREQVRDAQGQVERCLEGLGVAEEAFVSQRTETEALRARIRRLEGMDLRGVPADSYTVYLETVDRFNASVERWGDRGDDLEGQWEACRELIEDRNARADTFRVRLQAMGLLPVSPLDLLDAETGSEGDSLVSGGDAPSESRDSR